ncbi:neutral/alkaline non-lysosomal ceramidase N-terminal domain-containing protein [Algoriphagus zhangzhouensis]|uniref:Neutral/alkaline non-lysosomal ceramidase, N-terminal n=1 Tax=Algoriphagus zhangzhouensis TaxID=1073327 RepID=A0A1M7ZG94_9BACT|nr:neutral/alkaline non-lysosomal ceramidase N-terminal domain-containing protein [Algoriphagus zhangzhouensis]TDY44810.1 neutral/alkaline ceramidase-like enzyme [Algoriphagus zhangzhouensis]SHO63898.1 Neutral/alkaline non-lysosomal ceramidase, N-terminal [Algoriphagus zhangzhouensis]
MSLKPAFITFGKILLGIFLFLVVIGIFSITTVDRSPIQEQEFYKETFQDLESLPFTSTHGEFWLAGWGKANMTPQEPAELVGYAPRGPYEFVQDSSFVKSIVLSNGESEIAWINFELLIVHPFLAQKVEEKIRSEYPNLLRLIFTATHTHSGMGGYMPGPLGEVAFGGFDEDLVEMIADKSLQAIQQAQTSLDTASITFRQANVPELVANRFVKGGPIDPFTRELIFTQNSGKKASILTYSAHATCLSSKFMGLSGDYPFYLMRKMEESEYDLSIYAAGTVGSHRPVSPGKTPEAIQEYALDLDSLNRIKMTKFGTIRNPLLASSRLDLKLRDPHLRISDDLRLRPWLFNYLMGETNAHIDFTRIGNTLWIDSSGEISGIFYEKWDQLAKEKGLNLIITTFNGGYIGYITPDELYDEHFHEVREMNWYGPGNGRYFDDLITEIIEKSSE